MISIVNFDARVANSVIVIDDTLDTLVSLIKKRDAFNSESTDDDIHDLKDLLDSSRQKYSILKETCNSTVDIGRKILDAINSTLISSADEYNKYFGIDLSNKVLLQEVPFDFRSIYVNDENMLRITPINPEGITPKLILDKYIPEGIEAGGLLYSRFKDLSLDDDDDFFKDISSLMGDSFNDFLSQEDGEYINEINESRLKIEEYKTQLSYFACGLDALAANVNSVLGVLDALKRSEYSL